MMSHALVIGVIEDRSRIPTMLVYGIEGAICRAFSDEAAFHKDDTAAIRHQYSRHHRCVITPHHVAMELVSLNLFIELLY